MTQREWFDRDRPKNPAAQALGKLGASKGGKARAASMTAERRQKIAGKASRKRWARLDAVKAMVIEDYEKGATVEHIAATFGCGLLDIQRLVRKAEKAKTRAEPKPPAPRRPKKPRARAHQMALAPRGPAAIDVIVKVNHLPSMPNGEWESWLR